MKHLSILLLSYFLWLSGSAKAQMKDSVTFAVMGNSISTYYGYIPDGYKVFYTADKEKKYGIQVGDTWWMQLSRLSGLSFLANASWSGSRVSCDLLNSDAPFVSNARVAAVGRAGVPDLIFIMGGTNDWNQAKLPLGNYSTDTFTDSLTFRGAYAMLLHKLSTRYPDTKLVCLSITPRLAGVDQQNAIGYSQADANESIKRIAKQFGGYYIDCTTADYNLPACSCYLPSAEKRPYLNLQIAETDNTELLSQESTASSKNIYNIAGQRLQKIRKGINIVNGEKVVRH